jgi:hypothetical protein
MSTGQRFEGVVYIRQWGPDAGLLTFWCPGCEKGHTVRFGGTEAWDWNGDVDKPTLTPSVLVNAHRSSFSEPGTPRTKRDQKRCHSFVRDGKIEYLSDSEHELADHVVDMVALPERYKNFLSN